LGLIYCNIGELDIARKYIEQAIEEQNISKLPSDEVMKLKFADALIGLKLGYVRDSGIRIRSLFEQYETKLDNTIR